MTDTRSWLTRAACRRLPVGWWYPEREGAPSMERMAVATCRGCPVRGQCLLRALNINEEHGIHGGAGEARRRALRRAMAADGVSTMPRGEARDEALARAATTGELARALAAHWRRLDGIEARPGDRELLVVHGHGATHGRPGTYAKGCDCAACSLAISIRTAGDKRKARRRPTSPSRAA